MSAAHLGELRGLRAELLELHRDIGRLRAQNAQLVAANRDLSVQLTTASRSGAELLRHMVAFRQLLEAADAPSALRGIADILVNVVGTEDFAVFTVGDSVQLRVVAGMGPALARHREHPPTLGELTAMTMRFVPLTIGEHLVGAISIEGLLPHREALTLADEHVLGLLMAHAATAIVVAQERAAWSRLQLQDVA